jgi:hypothetical protein
MRLITPAITGIKPSLVEVDAYKPNFLGLLFGLKPMAGRLVECTNVHRVVITNCVIDFEHTAFIDSVPYYEPVAFGNYLYEGITPIRHIDKNVWECKIENVRRIRIEKEYKEPQELRA